MKTASYYLDELHSREIQLRWSDGFECVDILDNGELIHQHSHPKQLEKGIVLPTSKGENLYIRLFTEPTRWEVLFGNRFLINSYNHSLETLKATGSIFYYIFLASLMFLMVSLLPLYKVGGLSSKDFLKPTMLIYIGLLVLFYLCGIFVKRGKIIWYFIGTPLYIIDTTYVAIDTFLLSETPFSALLNSNMGFLILVIFLIRLVFVFYLLKAFKHVVAVSKHEKEVKTKENDNLLDV